ncbi:MAG: 4Fe-4S binding protein [Coriobacteriia bacterium]
MPEDAHARPVLRRNWTRYVRPRSVVRVVFLAFFVYLCARLWMFYLWTVGEGAHVARPEAVAGLIPLGAYMSFFAWIKSGTFDPVVPAGMVIIIGALLLSFLFKRGFCGWICPVGSVWQAFGWAGRKALGRSLRLPRVVDLALRGLRYVSTAMFVGWLAFLPVAVALEFQTIPYYAVADIKILSLLVRIKPVYLAVGAVVGVGSFLLGNAWCRYLCPLGGLYGACGVASLCTVVRDPGPCIDCGRCAAVCHAAVPVDRLRSVRAPECDGCLDCVLDCPAPGALTARAFGSLRFPWWVWPVGVVGTWLLVYIVALATGHWRAGITEEAFVAAVRALGI